GSSPAKPTAAGAGKLNAGAAIAPGATVDPVSVSFGLLTNRTAFPVNGEMLLTNVGSGSDTFRLDVQAIDADSNAGVTVNGSNSASVQLGAGQTARVPVAVAGRLPNPGLYQGIIRIQGTSANLRVPYLYAVLSNRPRNIFPILGDLAVGTAGKRLLDPLV